jgi:8-oxo-dGTP diphosphatase
MPQLSKYISVDCVIFGFDFEQLNVLLVERSMVEPITGAEIFSDLTLTGNHIFDDEDLDAAATRILFDLTGLEGIYLEQFKVFGNPNRLSKHNDQLWLQFCGRDPQSRIITVGYYSLLNTNKVILQRKGRNVKWYPISEITELAFDHKEILDEALKALRNKLKHEPIGFELLPEKFTLSQMQKLYEIILGIELDKRNFRKKIARMAYLEPLNEKQKGVSHKPGRFYTFNKDVFENTKKEFLNFLV